MNQAEALLPLFWRESHEELRELKNIDKTVQASDRYKANSCYTFAVVGRQAANIHSAIECKNGELHSYLKLAQVKLN